MSISHGPIARFLLLLLLLLHRGGRNKSGLFYLLSILFFDRVNLGR